MAILRLVLKNIKRRGWYFKLTAGILSIAVLCLLASLGALRGITDRVRFAEGTGLLRVGRVYKRIHMPISTYNDICEISIDLLSQEDIVGIATVTESSVQTTSDLNAPHYRIRYINQDAAELLMPRGLKGAWLSEIDWTSADEPIPIVVSKRVGIVGQVLTLWFANSPKTFKVVGTFDPKSYYLQNGSDLLLRTDNDIFAPDTALTKRDLFLSPVIYVIARSPQIMQANKDQWTRSLNQELARLGIAGEMVINTMIDWRDDFLRSRRDMIVLSLWLTGIVIVLATFGYGSINAVSVWDRSVEIGTYYATGATRQRVILILLLEMVIPLIVPTLLCIMVGLLRFTYDVVLIDWIVVLQTITVIGVVGFLSTVGPFIVMRRVRPSMLLRGEYR